MGRTMLASLSAELKILDTPPEVPAGISMREVETRKPSAFKTIRALNLSTRNAKTLKPYFRNLKT